MPDDFPEADLAAAREPIRDAMTAMAARYGPVAASAPPTIRHHRPGNIRIVVAVASLVALIFGVALAVTDRGGSGATHVAAGPSSPQATDSPGGVPSTQFGASTTTPHTSSVPPPSSTQTGSSVPAVISGTASGPCTAAFMRVSTPTAQSGATGDIAELIELTNTSSVSCAISKSPSVGFFDGSGVALPFVVQDTAHGASTPVVVAPKARAYVLIDKYRCDIGDERRAASLSIGFGDQEVAATTRVELPPYPDLSYCGLADPGSIVHVSHVALTPADTRA